MDEQRDSAGEPSRIEAISTRQSLLWAAHCGPAELSGPARGALALRYRRAVRRYLGALLRDDGAADEVAQEVVVKILKGDFAGVQSARGRFRDYLKTAVRNAALSHLRRRRPHEPADLDQLTGPGQGGPAAEDAWLTDWRRSLLDAARQALQDFQDRRPGNVYATLLQLLIEHQDEGSEQLAARLSAVVGQPYRADAVRQQVGRARRKFAEFLLEEVAHTLEEPAPGQVEAELIEVGLLPYVQDFLPPDWKARQVGG